MYTLSKSKLIAFRQCPKRLWLEIHHPDQRKDSAATQAGFAAGHQVGDIARQLYAPEGNGQLIDAQTDGFEVAFAQSLARLKSDAPIFEAGFKSGGALAFADILLPARKGRKKIWRMVEVKSSTGVKDYHRDDCAIQAYVARAAGVPLDSIALAHIDSEWIYPGDGDYQGLLKEVDLTDEAFEREEEVKDWIAAATKTAAKKREPHMTTGKHCSQPFECGFLDYCQAQEPQTQYPVHWLPRIQAKALKAHIETLDVPDMLLVPDDLLNEIQKRVKHCTRSDITHFNRKATVATLKQYTLPAYFIDFETVQFAVPIWKGTRPYQQLPFQFSVHRLQKNGALKQQSFLDLSGEDPTRAFALALIKACGDKGPIFVYNAAFERARIEELAERYPRRKQALLAIIQRLVDLLPIAREHYYHPSQQGSWSIKKVLPALVPDLRYEDLDGVQDGRMAIEAFVEAIAPGTSLTRKKEIERELLNYCALDTYAMVRVWQIFADRTDLTL